MPDKIVRQITEKLYATEPDPWARPDGSDALSRLGQAEHRIRELGGRAAKDGQLAATLSALRDELESLGEYQAEAARQRASCLRSERGARLLNERLNAVTEQRQQAQSDLERSGRRVQDLERENTRLNSRLNELILGDVLGHKCSPACASTPHSPWTGRPAS
jgi:hypothetical protein